MWLRLGKLYRRALGHQEARCSRAATMSLSSDVGSSTPRQNVTIQVTVCMLSRMIDAGCQAVSKTSASIVHRSEAPPAARSCQPLLPTAHCLHVTSWETQYLCTILRNLTCRRTASRQGAHKCMSSQDSTVRNLARAPKSNHVCTGSMLQKAWDV